MQTSFHRDPELRGDLEQIGFVTRNFNGLRGLLTAWVGLFCLIEGLFLSRFFYIQLNAVESSGLTIRSYAVLLLGAAGLALFFVFAPLLFALQKHYQHAFGVVQERGRQYPIFLLLLASSFFFDIPTGLFVHIYFGMFWVEQGLKRPQVDRLLLGLGILAIGACQRYLPLPDGISGINLGFIVGGASGIVTGLLDHRQLVSILPPLTEPSDAFEPGAVEDQP